jgi:hypothetical protein
MCVCEGGSQDCAGMRELKEALALAVKEERFEDAASLRDAMSSMKARTGGTPLTLFKSMCPHRYLNTHSHEAFGGAQG